MRNKLQKLTFKYVAEDLRGNNGKVYINKCHFYMEAILSPTTSPLPHYSLMEAMFTVLHKHRMRPSSTVCISVCVYAH